MNSPLVTVICLCHNHDDFVEEAIRSVLNQTYKHVELIVVDDASTDESRDVILNVGGQELKTIFLDANVGNCKAFNLGFSNSKGEFIIDLAADDILEPDRIAVGVDAFMEHDIGVHHGNMMMIREDGSDIGLYHEPGEKIPQGWIYKELLARHFIGGPSTMVKREVLERMGGYDEHLAYEDFDFWVRSSRGYKYLYTTEVLAKKRLVSNSLSRKQYKFRSSQLRSTYEVCLKAHVLNQTVDEHRALNRRIRYEMRKAIETGNLILAKDFFMLLFRKY